MPPPEGRAALPLPGCEKDFTHYQSGTLFASHKLPLRCYLAAIAIFCNEVKGKSALALSRDLSVSYKCAFVLLHKLREAMAEELKGRTLGGEGKVVGSRWRILRRLREARQLTREPPRPSPCSKTRSGKRKVVVIVRERDGNSLPAVFRSESMHWILSAPRRQGDHVNADEAGSWEELHRPLSRSARSTIKRLTALDGACTNWAEEFFSRMRRAEIGHHHHIAGAYLLRYAQEASWREDNRRVSNGEQVDRVAGLAMKRRQRRFYGILATAFAPS